MAESDLLCNICKDGTSEPPNEIVICDVCNVGYHQRCHKPKIQDKVLEPNVLWSCRLCVFALGVAPKESGPEKKISRLGDSSRQGKTRFPYEQQILKWDELHRTNHQNTYCYCGGPGEFFSKMLQCNKCRQWFHEGCIDCLETPLLYGDHYYMFSCAVCNSGKETVKRIIMKWSDVVALVLHNLQLQKGKRFFELQNEIIPFVRNNCHMIKLSEDINKLCLGELLEKITSILTNNPTRFMTGKEAKRKSNTWALRPIKGHHIFAPPHASIMNNSPAINSDINIQDTSCEGKVTPKPPVRKKRLEEKVPAEEVFGVCRKSAQIAPKSKNVVAVPHAPNKLVAPPTTAPLSFKSKPKHKPSLNKVQIGRINCLNGSSLARSSSVSGSEAASSTSSKSSSGKIGYPGTLIADKKPGVKRMKKRLIKDEPPVFPNLSLEVVIPFPENFEGKNNPFYDIEEPIKKRGKKKKSSTSDKSDMEKNGVEEDYIVKSSADSPSKLTIQRVSTSPLSKEPRSQDSIPNNFFPNLSSKKDSYEATSKLGAPDQQSNFKVLARRMDSQGKVEYLLEWEGAVNSCNN